ncbi:MAG: hypothetical protein WDO73_37990 [Ignavibacteriota bacterium]
MKRYLPSILLAANLLTAQSLDPKLLLKPLTDIWPTYNGDYSGKRFSSLNQIHSGNVSNLTLAWMYRIANVGPQRGVGNPEIKSTPLMVNGTLYFTIPDHVWALDARTGEELWHYGWKIMAVTWWAIAGWACMATGYTS